MLAAQLNEPRRPTGRRAITALQLAATASLTGQFEPTSPGRVLAAFKRAAPALGLGGSLVGFVDVLMRYSRPADWQGQWAPLVWPSNAELSDRLGVEISRVKQLIRAALDRGLILARDHGTRRRFGRRQGDRIVEAYGLDLSPLGERLEEFQRVAAEYEARIEEGRALRREISRLRAAALSLADYGLTQGEAAETWASLAQEAREVAAPARHERDPLRLAPIAARLRGLHERAEATLVVAFPVEIIPTDAESSTHHTTTKQLLPIPTGTSVADGETQEKSRRSRVSSPTSPSGVNGTALRGFPATPQLILTIAPAFRDLVPSARPSWSQIIEAADYVRGQIGVSRSAWGQACVVLGRVEAAVAVAAISARHERGLVRSPGGLLRCMVERHLGGELRLDRTLFGLVDNRRHLGTVRAENIAAS